MSGSKSSAPDVAPTAEALRITVYDLAGAAGDAPTRRPTLGRVKMLLVLLVCASPVIASYLTYFLIKPDGRTNYGSLIVPTRSIPTVDLHRLDGQVVPAPALKGQWLLVAVGPAACDGACEKRLFAQRQLREMLGRERERLEKLWFVTDDAKPSPTLLAALLAPPEVTLLRYPRQALTQWLTPEPGQQLEDHLYLVDPMGEWMMRFPVEFDPAKVKRDIDRLLRAASSWDRAGR